MTEKPVLHLLRLRMPQPSSQRLKTPLRRERPPFLAGENMPAYHARPASADGPLPIVIVVQEIFGVHEHIRDLCRRLALEGYPPLRQSSISVRAIRTTTAISQRF